MNETDLCDALEGTLFAPNDEAFEALPPDVAECLTAENKTDRVIDALSDILKYHVTKSELNSNALTVYAEQGIDILTLLDGETISVNITDDKLILNNNSMVVEKFDVPIVNGEQ